MKKLIIRTIATLLLTAGFIFVTPAFAQDPPPPPNQHGSTTNQSPPGGGVPIGSGLAVLIALGAAYGGRKLYKLRQQD